MTNEQFPVANWPQKSGQYKVVQLYLDERLYLLFGSEDIKTSFRVASNHGEIVRNFLESRGVNYQTFKPDNSLPIGIPRENGARYHIDGAGQATVWSDERIALFMRWELSSPPNIFDYDMGISRAHLNEIRLLDPNWRI